MKNIWGILLLISLTAGAQPVSDPATIFEKSFSVEQFRQDFTLFRTSLEKLHPGLYRYSSRSEMDSVFDQAYQQLASCDTYQDFYKILALVNAQIHCQHTAVAPSADDIQCISSFGKIFPYEILWDFDPVKAYAFSDLSNEGGIKPATEILKINGMPVQAVYDTLMNYLYADGYNITSKQVRLIPTDFQYWYYFLIERPDTFELEFLVDGEVQKKKVKAVTFDEFKQNVKKYIKNDDPDIRRLTKYYIPKQKLRPYRLEFLENSTALLTLKEFGPLEFMHKSFKKIKRKKIENLIIDVRLNGGGWDDRGYTLFSYLIDRPTPYFDSIYATATDIEFLLKHSDKDSAWWEITKPQVVSRDGILLTPPTPENGFLQQPKENRFTGNVYVLMSGKSMSTTAEFTAAAHYNNLATFIGEESGGAYCGGNGGDFATIVLPNTKLTMTIPLAKYVMAIPPENCNGHGTIPHYKVKTTVKDLYELSDPQLEFALQLIKERSAGK